MTDNSVNQNVYPGPASTVKVNHYLLSVIIISVSALICIPLSNTQSYYVVSFILLFVVSLLATFMRLGPVLLAASLSALVWNYFFIPPHYTFHIEKAEDILMFGMFFIIALLNGVLTTRVRRQEQLARVREERTNALFQLTKELSKAVGIEDVLKVAIENISIYFNTDSLFILQDGANVLHSKGRLQKEKRISAIEHDAADFAFRQKRPTGKYTDSFPDLDFSFYPLIGTRINPGVIAVKFEGPPRENKKAFWDTFITQIANALEREFLGELAQKVRFLDESDRLYKTLFNSISHELRIPVSTIMGASDTILNSVNSTDIQKELNKEIFTASLRLNRLIENLLNMTRLESGHFSVRLDWYDINDLINKVTEDLKEELAQFYLEVKMDDDLPPVKIDFGLIEQVLYNLLLNSAQYAPAGSAITLYAGYSNKTFVLEISDKGPGFPESEIQHVFKKFFRVDNSKTGGLGLGLSIVKGFVEAHQGFIRVVNMPDGGARFTIQIPSESPEINKAEKLMYE